MGSSGLFEPLGRQFTPLHFGDLFNPIWIAAAIGLVITIVLYNVRTRQLHRHEPLRAMQEWLLWTGLATFSLILIGAIFRFYFLFVLLFIVIGIATFIWIRFVRFPPLIDAYNEQLRRVRFFTQARARNFEATVRQKRARSGGQRRRKR
jgi:hypothetical protein